MPRQTHPRTVASMKPPGTQILKKTTHTHQEKTEKGFKALTSGMTNGLLNNLMENERNAVKQIRETNTMHSRCV